MTSLGSVCQSRDMMLLVFFWFDLATYHKFGECLSITGHDALGVLLVSSSNL